MFSNCAECGSIRWHRLSAGELSTFKRNATGKDLEGLKFVSADGAQVHVWQCLECGQHAFQGVGQW